MSILMCCLLKVELFLIILTNQLAIVSQKFFDNPTWEYFVADSGEEIVEFSGNLMYEDTEVKARLQFIMHQDNTFEVGALSFNDVPQNILVTNQMLRAVFIPEADQNEAGNQETTTVSDENDKQNDPRL